METQPKRYARIVFCDFDGTITTEETFVGMFKEFTPELVAAVLAEMKELRLTLKEGVKRLLESIPSKSYPGMLEYIRRMPMRPGLVELLDFLGPRGIPFVVISGGLRGLVEAKLSPLRDRVHAIHAPDVDTNDEYLRVRYEYQSDEELIPKARVMALYDHAESAVIGDGVTDYGMALSGSTVFARDGLARHLDRLGKDYIPWRDFHDVLAELSKRWG